MAQGVRETGAGTRVGGGSERAGRGVPRAARPPAGVRLGRLGYALVATAFAVAVAIQVFMAGLGVFGGADGFGWHTSFVHVFEGLPFLLLPLALLGRLGGAALWLPLALVALIGAQYATANANVVNLATLHPVIALVIFWLATVLARRGWRAVAREATV